MKERVAKPSSREALLQISRCICAEVSKEIDLWDAAQGYWRDIAGIVLPARSGVDRGLCDERSYSYALDDSAQVQRSEYGRFSEG